MHLITSWTQFTAASDPDRVVAGAGEAVKRRLMGRYFKSSAGLPGDAAYFDGDRSHCSHAFLPLQRPGILSQVTPNMWPFDSSYPTRSVGQLEQEYDFIIAGGTCGQSSV